MIHLFASQFFLFLISILLFSIPPIHPDSLDEFSIYESILAEPYYDSKMLLGEKLGEINTPKSNDLLKELLKNPYHWNREAAVAGIHEEDEKEFIKLLIRQFLADPILRPSIQKKITKKIDLYMTTLIQIYEMETNQFYKGLLESLIVISPDSGKYFKNTK